MEDVESSLVFGAEFTNWSCLVLDSEDLELHWGFMVEESCQSAESLQGGSLDVASAQNVG